MSAAPQYSTASHTQDFRCYDLSDAATADNSEVRALAACVSERVTALPICAADLRVMLEYVRAETEYPPTRYAVMDRVLAKSGGNLGVLRSGDRIGFNIHDEELTPKLEMAGKALFDSLHTTGLRVWYPPLSAVFRSLLELDDAPLTSENRDCSDFPYISHHFGELVVYSDRVKGPRPDFYVREGRKFTSQVITAFSEFLESYSAKVSEAVQCMRAVLLNEEARKGLLPRSSIEPLIHRAFPGAGTNTSLCQDLLEYLGLTQQRWIDALIHMGAGPVLGFREDEAVLGGYQLFQREPGWQVTFGEYAAPFVWIFNANAVLAACHIAPLSAPQRRLLLNFNTPRTSHSDPASKQPFV